MVSQPRIVSVGRGPAKRSRRAKARREGRPLVPLHVDELPQRVPDRHEVGGIRHHLVGRPVARGDLVDEGIGVAVLDADRRWMRALHGAALGSSAKFRGPFLLLADGIHELDPLNYIGIPWVYSDDGEHPDYDDESDDAERDDHADGDDDQGFGRPA